MAVDLELHLTSARDLAGQLHRQLRAAILAGRLRPGDALPPTRELAARLAVSRNTVTAAYDRLIAEGFLDGRVGAGTFVSEAAARAAAPRRAPSVAALAPRPIWETISLGPPPLAAPPTHDFRVGVPDGRLFPAAAWRRALGRALRRPGPRRASYGDPRGLPALRAAIAHHIGAARSVQAGADDILVTAGAQQAFDLIGRVLVEPGTVVAVEDPGYPMAHDALRVHGARIAPVPVDAEGLVVSALPDEARIVEYVTPSHQFPLGMPMSLPRRLALLAWAERRRAAIVEDDYDSEFRFGGRSLEPLQCLDRSGLCLYVGSFSKVLLPDLRVGYLVAPPSLQRALTAARRIADWYGAVATQEALADFIDAGLLARHVRQARRVYAERRERLDAALLRTLGDRLAPVPGAAGLHLSALFTAASTDDAAIAARAGAAGIALHPLSRWAIDGGGPRAPGLVLGYGAIAASRIDDGVRRLAALLRDQPPARAARARSK